MVNEGWIDSSIGAEKRPQFRDRFLDEDNYMANMRNREAIFKFIIQTFVFDPSDFPQNNPKYPVLLLGYNSIPLATELSQWKFPVTLMVKDDKEEKAAKNVMKRYNGDFKITKGNINGEKIIVWSDDNRAWSTERKFEFVKTLNDRSQILIVSSFSPALRDKIRKEIKNIDYVDKFVGNPLLIIFH